jgi:S-DNA-T family DNA segregation ATPase FtsK/SpoIIIE
MSKEQKGKQDVTFKDRFKQELLGLFWLATGLFLLLALISFHDGDSSFNNASQISDIHNLGGVIGSYLADLLFQGFGFAALLLPIGAFGLAWHYFACKQMHFRVLRVAAFFCMLLSLDGLIALQFRSASWFGQPIGEAGGLAGRLLANLLASSVNTAGAVILLIVMLLVSLMLAVRFSLVLMLDRVLTRWGTFLENRQQQRAARREAARIKKARVVEGPVIAPVDKAREVPPKARKKAPSKPVQEAFDFLEVSGSYQRPPLNLLDHEEEDSVPIDREALAMNARILEKKLKDFGVDGEVTEVKPGPVVTMYEFAPAPGVKVNKIAGLADDLAMALSAIAIRIVAPIPGRPVVGIEIPNKQRETVYLKEILTAEEFQKFGGRLPMALGKDIFGNTVVSDLAKMPHLLVAGATGSGKSVSVNTMILSLLYCASPEDVRIILIDPKMLELSIYEGIPHLLLPVVTNPKKAALAFAWAVREMERRYRLMADKGVRDIDGYNKKLQKEAKQAPPPAVAGEAEQAEDFASEVVADGEVLDHGHLPRIVVIVDELADLMMVAGREIEESIARLAQMARAAGIHLILATQRPSVDVITGLIKANLPTRISFKVFSRIDSRTILDQMGAENLLGIGDMLFLPPGTGALQRVHGAFVSEREVKLVVDYLSDHGKPEYDSTILEAPAGNEGGGSDEDEMDEKWDEALAMVAETRQASISMLQRRLRVGYNRAARMIEKMEQEGIVGPSDGTSRPREVFINKV